MKKSNQFLEKKIVSSKLYNSFLQYLRYVYILGIDGRGDIWGGQ